MKITLKIITILLVASIVAGGFVLLINKTLRTPSSTTGNTTSANGLFTGQQIHRPDGGESGASTARGLSGIFFMLIELSGITAIVLLLENLFGMLKNRKLHVSQR